MRYNEIDPMQEVTVTLPALQFLTIATQLLRDAREVESKCTKPETCTFCPGVANGMTDTARLILQSVSDAGTPVMPDHTAN